MIKPMEAYFHYGTVSRTTAQIITKQVKILKSQLGKPIELAAHDLQTVESDSSHIQHSS